MRPQCIGSEASSLSPPTSNLSTRPSSSKVSTDSDSSASLSPESPSFKKRHRTVTSYASKRPRPMSMPAISDSIISDSIMEHPACTPGCWASDSSAQASIPTLQTQTSPISGPATTGQTPAGRWLPEGRAEFHELYEPTLEGLGSGGHGTVLTYR